MRIINKIMKLLAVFIVASTLSFAAVAEHHEAGESGDGDMEVGDTTDSPPVETAPPSSKDDAAEENEEASD